MPTEPPASHTPEDFAHDMSETREHLGDQVRALGDKVMGMAGDASEAIADAVQGGKDAVAAVQGAIERAGAGVTAGVRQVLNVRGHVRRHPWLAVGCAVALGVCCGSLFRRRKCRLRPEQGPPPTVPSNHAIDSSPHSRMFFASSTRWAKRERVPTRILNARETRFTAAQTGITARFGRSSSGARSGGAIEPAPPPTGFPTQYRRPPPPP